VARTIVTAVLTILSGAWAVAASAQSPCEASGKADAIFIGIAQPMIRRRVELRPPQPAVVQYEVTPFQVERAFRGVSSPIVYIMPTGVPFGEFPAGQRYLVFAHSFEGTDMFMSTSSYGTQRIADATNELQFLDVIAPSLNRATISGRVELHDLDSVHNTTITVPLAGIAVTLRANEGVATTMTEGDGHFAASGLASGTYTASVQIPPDLALVKEPAPIADVRSGGCASLMLDVVPNGRIHGIMRTVDGQPARFEHVALMRGPLTRNGRDSYVEQVDTDAEGRFVLAGVPPGVYALGRLSANVDGVLYPSVYYPGTVDRAGAILIEVGRSTEHDVGEFVVPRRTAEPR
jgi:hypothetical protein